MRGSADPAGKEWLAELEAVWILRKDGSTSGGRTMAGSRGSGSQHQGEQPLLCRLLLTFDIPAPADATPIEAAAAGNEQAELLVGMPLAAVVLGPAESGGADAQSRYAVFREISVHVQQV